MKETLGLPYELNLGKVMGRETPKTEENG